MPTAKGSDYFSSILPFDYSGSFAVKIFFFISGLVVTNSLLLNKNTSHFIASRVFRIIPALVFFCMITCFFILPCFFDGSISEYFYSSRPYKYLINNSLMITDYRINGVFGYEDNNSSVINGSIWTIPYEMLSYSILLAAFSVKFLNKKTSVFIAFVFICIISLFQTDGFLVFNERGMERGMLAYCFSCGVLFSAFKEKIKISATLFALSIMVLCFSSKFVLYPFIFYISSFYILLCIASFKPLLNLKPKYDISYGVYLWGWTTQQVISRVAPSLGLYENTIISIAASMLLGIFSWVIIEKRFINIGRSLV